MASVCFVTLADYFTICASFIVYRSHDLPLCSATPDTSFYASAGTFWLLYLGGVEGGKYAVISFTSDWSF